MYQTCLIMIYDLRVILASEQKQGILNVWIKPIFHWKLGWRWLPNAIFNEINTKNMKCTWPTPEFCVGTQRNQYSTGLRLGFASGKTQILGFALAPRYQHVCIPNAKFWRRGYCPTPTPNARYFASQWNIGLREILFCQ